MLEPEVARGDARIMHIREQTEMNRLAIQAVACAPAFLTDIPTDTRVTGLVRALQMGCPP
jgi:hypothetical protein